MKHIIMGNGINIKFDKQPQRWNKFIIDCQVNFLVLLNESKISNNKKIKSIYDIWNIIKKYINFDLESNSLENITKYFNFWHYKEYFDTQEEYQSFLTEIWFHTLIPFLKEDDFPIEEPNFLLNTKALFELNTHFDSINKIYKKAIEITLFNEYKIHDINIPREITDFINDNYETKISINYDNNLDYLNDLKKLHGSYLKNIINYNEVLRKRPKKEEEFIKFIKENTLQWDMVLEKESKIKVRQLAFWDDCNKYGVVPTLRSFGIPNQYAYPPTIKSDGLFTYDMLEKLKGEIHIIGVSSNNDHELFNSLINNINITKIVFYNDGINEINNTKIENKHFNEFWNEINI